MPLYVFEIRGAPYVKMGFTAVCPWLRICDGLWSNVHPPDCCNKLGWSDLTLVALFEGSLVDERELQEAIPPECGEFWPSAAHEELLRPCAKGSWRSSSPQSRASRRAREGRNG
jgi:hypothetical protein